jgi:peptidyl-prolyl cis-trans isomerase A (cyclophilin A)
MKTVSVLLFAIVALGTPVCAWPQAGQQSAAPKAAGTTAPAAKKTGAPSATINRALLHPALLKARAPEVFKTRFTTTQGDFVIEVHRDWSPLGADRFYNLVKNGFYNNAHFFRVVSGFVVQFGLSPSPAVNKAWHDAAIQDDPVKQSNNKGMVTFASAGPNTRTTQLFINLGENGRLDTMGFSPFGTVTEGMNVVEKLYTGYGEAPDQGRIEAEGKPYLDKSFPLLDSIRTARLVVVATQPPAAKKTAPAAAKTPAKSGS